MTKEEKKIWNREYMRKKNATPEGIAYNKMAYQRDKLVKESQRLMRNYGITSEDYDVMYNQQEGLCAICGTHQTELKISLAVDHCHVTGKVRGLLCGPCNKALGLLRDSTDHLQAALAYLNKV